MPKGIAGEETFHLSDIWILLFPKGPVTERRGLESEDKTFQLVAMQKATA